MSLPNELKQRCLVPTEKKTLEIWKFDENYKTVHRENFEIPEHDKHDTREREHKLFEDNKDACYANNIKDANGGHFNITWKEKKMIDQ